MLYNALLLLAAFVIIWFLPVLLMKSVRGHALERKILVIFALAWLPWIYHFLLKP